jgi:hypothetical protein
MMGQTSWEVSTTLHGSKKEDLSLTEMADDCQQIGTFESISCKFSLLTHQSGITDTISFPPKELLNSGGLQA